MNEEIKIMLGETADNFTEAQISLYAKISLAEVEEYCNREADTVMELMAERLAVIKLNRINTEGLTAQGFSGISQSFTDEWPADIKAILNKKRRIRVV